MPYIDDDRRWAWSTRLDAMEGPTLDDATEGEINYFITNLLLMWLGSQPSYADYNAAIGILECIKLELYRRAVAPYEDEKCAEHGDVY